MKKLSAFGLALLFLAAAALARVSGSRSGARDASAGPGAGDRLLAAMG